MIFGLINIVSFKRIIASCAFRFQKLLLCISFFIFKISGVKNKKGLWVIGVDEIAANIKNVSQVLRPSLTVSFFRHKYYDYNYDFCLGVRNPLNIFRRFFVGPVLLGYLVNKADGFFYIWSSGFMMSGQDGRSYEFSFVKDKGKKIAAFFVGSDIRSPKLTLDFHRRHDLDCGVNYYPDYLLTDAYDESRKKVAIAADCYADYIFNAPVDQISYIQSKVEPFIYFVQDNLFILNDDKFLSLSPVKIFHASSNPIPKGTQLVRAAIKKLKLEGYVFEYKELFNVDNKKILDALSESHIVLNEFYAFLPGMFAIEALARHCAVLTSADPVYEYTLPRDAEKAWMVTHYWEVYENLKFLLTNHEKIKEFADRGFYWAKENFCISATQMKISRALKL